MTSNPLTIAGKTLTAEDWPEDVDWFDADGTWGQPDAQIQGVFVIDAYYQPDNLYAAVFWLRDDAPECATKREHRKLLPWISARCHLWHSTEAMKYPAGGYGSPHRDRYLASAAKWARISKGVKT